MNKLNLSGKKELPMLLLLVAVLLLAFFFGLNEVGGAITKAEAVKKDIAAKEAFVHDWKKQSNVLRQSQFRAVSSTNVDALQKTLFGNLMLHKLNLLSFNAISDDKKNSKSHEYEVVFAGNWDASIRFVENFSLGNALISVRKFHMETNDTGGVKTTIRYKVYLS